MESSEIIKLSSAQNTRKTKECMPGDGLDTNPDEYVERRSIKC